MKHIPARAIYRAFTLIELLVVITLMSIAAGLGGGLYAKRYTHMLTGKAARNLLMLARYARIAAMENQKPYRLHLDKQDKRAWLSTTGLDRETMTTKVTIIDNAYCQPVSLADPVNFEALNIQTRHAEEASTNTAEQTVITFYPQGTADSAVIQLGDTHTHYTIGVSSCTGKSVLVSGDARNYHATTIDLDAPES